MQTTVTITPNSGPDFSYKVSSRELAKVEREADMMKTQGKIKGYRFQAPQITR